MDLGNEDRHGPFVVVGFVDEELKNKLVNGIAILLPGCNPKEVDGLTLEIVDPQKIRVTIPAINWAFRTEKKRWMGFFRKNAKKLFATKLLKTLQVVMGKYSHAKKGKENEEEADRDPVLKRYELHIPDELDITVSNEYFSPKARNENDDVLVDKFPIPCQYQTDIAGKSYTHCDVIVVWRVYVVDSAKSRGASKPAKKKKGDSMMDMLSDMMDGTTISG